MSLRFDGPACMTNSNALGSRPLENPYCRFRTPGCGRLLMKRSAKGDSSLVAWQSLARGADAHPRGAVVQHEMNFVCWECRSPVQKAADKVKKVDLSTSSGDLGELLP